MKPSELIADPAKWTKGAEARNKAGHGVSATSESAVAWCADGALVYCLPTPFGYSSALQKVTSRILREGRYQINDWNDAPERTHAEVIEALKACGL